MVGGGDAAAARSLNGQDRNGTVVVVTSGKGGVGKTTTAASLAYGLAQVRGHTNVPCGTEEKHGDVLGALCCVLAGVGACV